MQQHHLPEETVENIQVVINAYCDGSPLIEEGKAKWGGKLKLGPIDYDLSKLQSFLDGRKKQVG